MKPRWRGQPFGNFRIVFNAALCGAQPAAVTPPHPDFREAPEGEKEDEEGNRGADR